MTTDKTTIASNLKSTMRNIPYPVAIATIAVGKEKRGITIGSFTSLSLEPPLISFNIDQSAQFHDMIRRATHFAVHLPLPDQSSLCDHFAVSGRTGSEQFEDVEHYRSPYGIPVLSNIGSVLQCRTYDKIPAGDHTIVIGEVMHVKQKHEQAGVLYYDRSYRSVGNPVPALKSINKSA